jgi:serine/threonine protein kinase
MTNKYPKPEAANLNPSACPSCERLAAALFGKLADHEIDDVTNHLDGCAECQSAAEELERASDTLGKELLRPSVVDTQTESEELGRLLAAAKALGPGLKAPDRPQSPPSDLGQLRDYRLLALLGKRGTGRVYKALDTKHDKLVAIKVLPAESLRDEKSWPRFEREMRGVVEIDHPHVVRTIDAGESDGTHFLVMEFVEGIDLRQLLRARGRLPAAEACELARQAALGLAFVHRQGWVHREVKPSNLVLSATGELKLLDVGAALLHERPAGDELTAAREAMSAFDYMAPEQALDAQCADPRSDIYSLGATLYHLLTGSAPFGYEADIPRGDFGRARAPTPLDQLVARLPSGLAELVAKMMAHDARDRYGSATEAAEALTPFAQLIALPPTADYVSHIQPPQIADAGKPVAEAAPTGWVQKSVTA